MWHKLLAVVVTTAVTMFVPFARALAEDAPRAAYLLDSAQRQIPNDTGSDGKTKMQIAQSAAWQREALQVEFAPGDSCGDRAARVKDWTRFDELRLSAFNPAPADVRLEMNIFHAQTTNFNTRIVQSLVLKPGANDVRLKIADLKNVNGSAPDLVHVGRWYLHDADSKSPTLYFGSIALVGGKAEPSAENADHLVQGDPARVKRIRAAKMPQVTKPLLFNTPEADQILAALEVYPPNNPWNLVVDAWPLHPLSDRMVAAIGADKVFRTNYDMGFVIVPPDQPRQPLKVVDYPDESDRGPFPIPDNVPIEGWPLHYRDKGVSLADVQRNTLKEQGDRHAIVLDPVNRKLYEFFVMRLGTDGWEAAQASVFDLATNRLRPDGWTSADAAGLPIFPAVVRYDEIERGMVEHAMRVTVPRSRKTYVYPATHHAGHAQDEHLPRMGERLRLKQNVDITGFSPAAQAILKGLKKYGMFVADNGIAWAISVAPDSRIPELHGEMRKLKGSDFEVIQPPPGYKPPTTP